MRNKRNQEIPVHLASQALTPLERNRLRKINTEGLAAGKLIDLMDLGGNIIDLDQRRRRAKKAKITSYLGRSTPDLLDF